MLAPTKSPRWYLVHCKPRQDERALEHLERQGFHCYRPLRPVERLRYGRSSTLPQSLFPGYLFIHLDCVTDNWYLIRSTRGVNRIVRFNDDPVPVADEIIEGIRERVADPKSFEPRFQPGERVQIAEGPFSQLEAIFLAKEGEERVVLLLNLLQQEQALAFPVRSVRKIV
jgi:transcriptional antiterminator RfaH